MQDEAVSFLKSQDADIIVLQEAFNGESSLLDARYRTVQVIKEQLNLPYASFSPNREQPHTSDTSALIGNSIISRYPILSSDSSVDEYNLQHAVVSTPAGEVNVFNLHGSWDLDGNKFSLIRQKMSRDVIAAIENQKKVILAGDTNAKPTNKAIVAITEYLKSVFGHELTTTFNMRRKDNKGYASAAVDMIFVGPDIGIIERSCPDVDVSDHLPLVAILNIE